MSNSGIEFVDELPVPRNRNKGEEFIVFSNALRSNPGRWAKVPHHLVGDSTGAANNRAVSIRTGRHSAFRPNGAFEARSVNGAVYARYVGGAA